MGTRACLSRTSNMYGQTQSPSAQVEQSTVWIHECFFAKWLNSWGMCSCKKMFTSSKTLSRFSWNNSWSLQDIILRQFWTAIWTLWLLGTLLGKIKLIKPIYSAPSSESAALTGVKARWTYSFVSFKATCKEDNGTKTKKVVPFCHSGALYGRWPHVWRVLFQLLVFHLLPNAQVFCVHGTHTLLLLKPIQCLLDGAGCQNHSADDAVRARAKGPCLERENWRPPSHPERGKKKEEVRG